jgi:hypothetical protein
MAAPHVNIAPRASIKKYTYENVSWTGPAISEVHSDIIVTDTSETLSPIQSSSNYIILSELTVIGPFGSYTKCFARVMLYIADAISDSHDPREVKGCLETFKIVHYWEDQRNTKE